MEYPQSLKNKIRVLTDYDSHILSEDDLDVILDIAVDEVEAVILDKTGDPTDVEDIDWTVFPAENALFWTGCLFSKIKAGELDGVPMSLGDMNHEALRTDGEESVIWFRRATNYANELLGEIDAEPPGTGHRTPNRHGYQAEPDSFYD